MNNLCKYLSSKWQSADMNDSSMTGCVEWHRRQHRKTKKDRDRHKNKKVALSQGNHTVYCVSSTVWVKKSPCGFQTFSPNSWEFL